MKKILNKNKIWPLLKWKMISLSSFTLDVTGNLSLKKNNQKKKSSTFYLNIISQIKSNIDSDGFIGLLQGVLCLIIHFSTFTLV